MQITPFCVQPAKLSSKRIVNETGGKPPERSRAGRQSKRAGILNSRADALLREDDALLAEPETLEEAAKQDTHHKIPLSRSGLASPREPRGGVAMRKLYK